MLESPKIPPALPISDEIKIKKEKEKREKRIGIFGRNPWSRTQKCCCLSIRGITRNFDCTEINMPRQKKIWKTHSVFSAARLPLVTFFVRASGWKIRAANFSAAGFGPTNATRSARINPF